MKHLLIIKHAWLDEIREETRIYLWQSHESTDSGDVRVVH